MLENHVLKKSRSRPQTSLFLMVPDRIDTNTNYASNLQTLTDDDVVFENNLSTFFSNSLSLMASDDKPILSFSREKFCSLAPLNSTSVIANCWLNLKKRITQPSFLRKHIQKQKTTQRFFLMLQNN